MTGNDLNELYGAIIAPTAVVSVPDSWLPVIHETLAALRDLPIEVRAFLIVSGISEQQGELVFEMMAATPYIPEEGMQLLKGIIETAQTTVQRRVH
ncbi:hypothetical protein [Sinorhizobium meliloti]|uniref:hypothetical protein n=1 Tax=Rhizobium meliloti TaxID=382 RepID=UPI000FDA503D|nr:hypothetical protein [Sinorhizobium meliloti]RVO68381.1 hypothetical protein CN087_12970 [Sinorhizobium meliloti]